MAFILLFALIASSMVLAAAASAGGENQALVRRNAPGRSQQQQPHIEILPPPDLAKDYDLLDIVLVASVDGKFHALNRTSGRTLWSMASFATTTSVSAPSALSPLVRTTHPQFDADLIDFDTNSENHETYIIEPQSGDIYVLHSPSAPLQRFPFSMSELVEISPFTWTNGEDEKVFVGRKETSLLLIELETGKIKATLNSECPFMPDDSEELPIDLDELEGSKPPTSAPTNVYIGRTDYHISIHKKPAKGLPPPPVQKLSFSTYGPNNKDNKLQSMYRRTRDDTYIQSLPNGEIVAFRTSGNQSKDSGSGVTGAFWGRPFPSPIVAVFDVLKQSSSHSPHHHNHPPFVLLQPRPRIQDLFTSIDESSMYHGQPLPNTGSAFVGLVEETGSLFALSPEHYPLVVFGGHDGVAGGISRPIVRKKDSQGTYIDPPRQDMDYGDDEDSSDPCLQTPYHPRCLVGIRTLEDNDVEWRAKRLLDGPKTQMPARQQPMEYPHPSPALNTGSNGSGSGGLVVVSDPKQTESQYEGSPALIDGHARPGSTSGGFKALLIGNTSPDGPYTPTSGVGAIWEGIIVTLLFGVLTIWVMWNKVKGRWFENGAGKSRIRLNPTAVAQQPPVQKAVVVEPVKEHAPVTEDGPEPPVKDEAMTNGGLIPPQPITTTTSQNADIQPPPTTPVPILPSESLESSSTEPSSIELEDIPPPVPPKENTIKPSLPLAPLPNTPLTPSTPALGTPTTAVPETPSLSNGTPAVPSTPASATPASSTLPSNAVDDGDDSDAEGEGANGAAATPGKRKNRRGRRGKKKKPGVVAAEGIVSGNSNSSAEGNTEGKVDSPAVEEEKKSSLVITTSMPKPAVQSPTLIVTDTILGFGSHGTVVLEGSLQGRAVAVKRLLNDFVTLAEREVSILQESDDHPNVIRYYYQESQGNFLYIALELCPASLADIVENPDRDAWRDIAINFDPKKALKQITSGLRHLHALKLIHRDIKPQNILISASSLSKGGFGARGPGAKSYRMLISDFGLCKKLETDETSFLPTAHGAMGAGTVGWRAPEIMRGDVKLDYDLVNGDDSFSSRGSAATIGGSSSGSAAAGNNRTRLTKSVDIFALGCLFYYTLTNGGHPFGDRFEREANIMRDAKNLSTLERFGEEGTEAADLITAMLCPEAKGRPDTTTILLHPFFWDAGRRLNFLQDASDRFEIMCRDPRDPNLVTLETGAMSVVGNDWHSRLDKIFIDNLGKYRKYDGKSVQDLMRAMRNKKHHYQDLPDNVKRHLGPLPEGFLGYFTRRYPQLFLHVHGVVKETGLHSESMFRAYFELPDN